MLCTNLLQIFVQILYNVLYKYCKSKCTNFVQVLCNTFTLHVQKLMVFTCVLRVCVLVFAFTGRYFPFLYKHWFNLEAVRPRHFKFAPVHEITLKKGDRRGAKQSEDGQSAVDVPPEQETSITLRYGCHSERSGGLPPCVGIFSRPTLTVLEGPHSGGGIPVFLCLPIRNIPDRWYYVYWPRLLHASCS